MTASKQEPEYNGRHPHYLLLERAKKAAAKAEREQVLGLIATYCACNGIEERIIGGDRFYEVEGTFSLPDFLNYIASLHGGEQR